MINISGYTFTHDSSFFHSCPDLRIFSGSDHHYVHRVLNCQCAHSCPLFDQRVHSPEHGSASGKDKARLAAEAAISSPLLDSSINGAKGVIVNITASPDIDLDDIDIASSMIHDAADPDVNLIWGATFDDTLQDEMRITVIATGFDNDKNFALPDYGSFGKKEAAAPAKPAEQPSDDDSDNFIDILSIFNNKNR